jgi:hypothetical protein
MFPARFTISRSTRLTLFTLALIRKCGWYYVDSTVTFGGPEGPGIECRS